MLIDVETELAQVCGAALAPGGASSVGAPCHARRGWPVSQDLDAKIKAGNVEVTIFSRPGMSKNTTRYPLQWQQLTATAPTLTISVTGTTVAIGGAAGVAQNIGVLIGASPYVYPATASDTPASAAAGLAKLIPGAAASGATITLSAGSPGAQVAVGAFANMAMEVRREWQELQISIWAPTPALRDSVSGVLDLALAQMPWLPLADGTSARLLYRSQRTFDETQKAAVWRRDIYYGVEFGISAQQQAAQSLFGPQVSVT